jgi:CheY-like chemotaxis protein/signal transduction histidine kinase/CHASE3 domain sensor protein
MSHPPRHDSWLTNLPIQRKLLLAIVLLLGVALAALLATLNSLRAQNDARHWYMHTSSVLQEIDGIHDATKAAQVGVRGYLLGGRTAERDAYLTEMRSFPARLRSLRALVIDNPLEQTRIDRLETLIAQWQQEVATAVTTPMAHVDTAHDDAATAIARQRIQAGYMNDRTIRATAILATLKQMATTEQQLLASRTARLDTQIGRIRALDAGFVVLLLLLGALVLRLCFRQITGPLLHLTGLMNRLAAHDHAVAIGQTERADEIGQIARALQVFKDMAIRTHDDGWLKSQVATITRQLQEATTHGTFGTRLVDALMPLLGAGIGLLYLRDEANDRLDLVASYGFRADAESDAPPLPGTGLVRQCATDGTRIELDTIPPDYLHIASGSGDALPHHLVIEPVRLGDAMVGVLEFAAFATPTPLQHRLLEQLLPVVAQSLDNLSRAVRTANLLGQTSDQADQLRVSSITLRQQREALAKTNDQLHAKTLELEAQSQRLQASEEELRVQAEELQASNEELRLQSDTLQEQKRTLETLQTETAEKADELARASQYKSEFLANMSHELRTPLNSLLILSRSLAENRGHRLDAEEVESARIIHEAGSGLLALINDILDLSKIEAGKMQLAMDDCALAAFARRLQRNFDHVARDKHLDFEVTLDDGLPEHLHTDPGKLDQIVNNLLANAFKFTAHGAVRVRVGRPAADLPVPATLKNQSLLAIAVSDTGIGIPADKQEKIFAAFEQVDAGTSRQYGGTGLGLSISRRLAALLGGDVLLHSESGRGSTFTLLLPQSATLPGTTDVAAPTPPAIPVAPATPTPPARPGNAPILIVEDDPAFARILADLVRHKGLPLLQAGDGESALDLARSEHPAGILLDVMLPGIDGWRVLDQLKADPATADIPVHFLSATDGADRSRASGAVGFLTKPATREQIDVAVERLLQRADDHLRHVLVICANPGERAALHALLQRDQVRVDEAESAAAAQAWLTQARCDCIVLDLDLPDGSGSALLEQLSASGTLPPVVLCTAREPGAEETLHLRQYTDSIVVKGAHAPQRLLDEVSLFLHRLNEPTSTGAPVLVNGLAGRRVLLVDDDMRNLFALSKLLRDWGLTVAMAQDGPRALQALQGDAVPELVLTDIMMPGMDGYELIRRIRTLPAGARLPIIALTAKAMRGDREQCLAAGASDYLTKPVDADKLASMLRVWLRRPA